MSFKYDFPSELLLSIFGEVESYEDILTLAATCRRFNHLSLQVFFSKHNFDQNSKTIILRPYDDSLKYISALTMSLALRRTSLEHLSFDFDYYCDTRLLLYRIRTLTRYIMNLTTIDRVTLHIMIPYVPVVGDWKAAYAALLETAIEKSCSNLHVETYTYSDDLTRIPKTASWSRIPDFMKSNGEVKHLKDCFIQAFPAFLRPFYIQVLKANAPVLTSLAFKSISGRMTSGDWESLITNIRLPVLKRFAISFSDIPQDTIIKFLSKHRHLTDFEYHHIGYTIVHKGVRRGFKDGFKHLEQLTTAPEHILGFLPTMDRMPCLTSIAIIIKDGNMGFSLAEQALRRLSSCVKKIKLKLDVGPPFEAAHEQTPFQLFWKEDGVMLRCVESLYIIWGWQYTADDLGHIPAWLKRFPELTKLTLNWSEQHISRPLGVEPSTLPPFFEQVKLACPAITSISFPGESDWTL